jgi:hypothetical protein
MMPRTSLRSADTLGELDGLTGAFARGRASDRQGLDERHAAGGPRAASASLAKLKLEQGQ